MTPAKGEEAAATGIGIARPRLRPYPTQPFGMRELIYKEQQKPPQKGHDQPFAMQEAICQIHHTSIQWVLHKATIWIKS